MPFGIDIGLIPGDFVLDGDPVPSPKRGRSPPKFSARVYCGQTAEWIKMVGQHRRLCVRRGPSPYPQRGGAPSPIFGPFLLWPNGWMHQDATWYGGRPQPRRLHVRWGPSFPSLKGAQSPNFRSMSLVAKRLDGLRWHLVWR